MQLDRVSQSDIMNAVTWKPSDIKVGKITKEEIDKATVNYLKDTEWELSDLEL